MAPEGVLQGALLMRVCVSVAEAIPLRAEEAQLVAVPAALPVGVAREDPDPVAQPVAEGPR